VALEEDIDFEVLHATEFLADLLEAGRLPLRDDLREQMVTYHDPCDLGRKSDVFEAPRRILAQIPGLTLVEMPENREGLTAAVAVEIWRASTPS
jgi:Fe-S oxidoreductase